VSDVTTCLPAGRVSRLTLATPTIPTDLVLRLQKYRDLGRVPPVVRRVTAAVAAEASRLVEPAVVVWRGPVTAVDSAGLVTLDRVHRFHSRVLARLLAGSTEALVFVMTLGPALEARTQRLLEEKLYVEGVLLDTAAWAAIELLRQALKRRLADEARGRGGTLTARLGPGHGDWPVEEQPALFRVFGDVPLPVAVNDSACMLPRKSVSGVFGVVPARG
jgi:hypothetical protein